MKNDSLKKNRVLYQKMGSTWYVFTEVNNEIYFTPVDQNIDPTQNSFELSILREEQAAGELPSKRPSRRPTNPNLGV